MLQPYHHPLDQQEQTPQHKRLSLRMVRHQLMLPLPLVLLLPTLLLLLRRNT